MSIIYETTLSPSKYELLAAWLPSQPWFTGDVSRLEPVGAYRLDDPEGEVGFEGHLFTAGGDTIFHAPLSYRGAPLEEGEAFLVGTLEHGVLGKRWVSDAIGDPAFRAVVATVMVQGSTGEMEHVVGSDGESVAYETSVRVAGTGSPGLQVPELWAALVSHGEGSSLARTEFCELEVLRIISPTSDRGEDEDGTFSLRGAWGGERVGVPLAILRA